MTNLMAIDGGRTAQREQQSELLSCQVAEATIVVGCMRESEIFDAVQDLLRPEHFEAGGHMIVYAKVAEMRAAGAEVGVVAVLEALRADGKLQKIGGAVGLSAMVECSGAVTPRGARELARVIQTTWARRTLLSAATAMQTRALMDPTDVATLAADHRGAVDDLLADLTSEQRTSDARSVMRGAVSLAQAAAQNAGVGARPSGFHSLDRLTAGLHSELMLLGARPGMGKTSLATSIAVSVAARGECAYIASLETPAETLGLRMACAEAGVSMHAARAGLMSHTDWSRLSPAASRIADLPLYVDDESAMSVSGLWARCRRARIASGLKLGIVVVDYIQLIRPPRSGMKREEVVAENARALKAMAQDLDCPVLALAQLNRGSEQRGDHRPSLADLRESGELEQCARTVMFIYRKDYYRTPSDAKTNEAEIIVAKQNNGPTGSVMMHFNGECLQFTEVEDQRGDFNRGA